MSELGNESEAGEPIDCRTGAAELRAYMLKQRSEIKRLREWVNDLQSGMWINCVYCGHRYGPRENTPVAMADVLKEHISKCPKHPLSKAEAKIKRLLAGNLVLIRKLEVANDMLRSHQQEIERLREECNRRLCATCFEEHPIDTICAHELHSAPDLEDEEEGEPTVQITREAFDTIVATVQAAARWLYDNRREPIKVPKWIERQEWLKDKTEPTATDNSDKRKRAGEGLRGADE